MKRNTFLKTLLGLPFVAPLLSFSKAANTAKIIFTPEMLRRNNYGLFIINTKVTDVKKNPSYAATVAWKLCYQHNHWKNTNEEPQQFNVYGKVNFLTDGWFYPIGNTKEQVCEYLNNNPHGETFRLMTKEEVIYLITNRKQGFL
jgi:hypothetical protein